jgi:L-threonylcarbamoyladenylate synthase
VRCPDDPVLISLIERCGPLAASSANRAGQSTLSGAEAVRHEFGDSLAVVADGDRVRNHASTVIDVSVKPWKLLRSGPITSAEIEALLG